jgi:prophage regulatory protein
MALLPNVVTPLSFIKLREVTQTTTQSKSQIYLLIARGEFPKQIHLSEHSVVWVRAEVEAWMQARIDQSRATAA